MKTTPPSFEKDGIVPVYEFEDLYLVHQDGVVKSIRTGNALKAQKTKKGYWYYKLWKGNKPHGRFIQRIVLQSFTPSKGEGLEANHIDGNPSNNSLSNLEWLTSSENKKHSVHKLGRRAPCIRFGVDNYNIKAVVAYDKDGFITNRYKFMLEAEKDGFKAASICHAIKGIRQKTHAGLFWRYAE